MNMTQTIKALNWIWILCHSWHSSDKKVKSSVCLGGSWRICQPEQEQFVLCSFCCSGWAPLNTDKGRGLRSEELDLSPGESAELSSCGKTGSTIPARMVIAWRHWKRHQKRVFPSCPERRSTLAKSYTANVNRKEKNVLLKYIKQRPQNKPFFLGGGVGGWKSLCSTLPSTSSTDLISYIIIELCIGLNFRKYLQGWPFTSFWILLFIDDLFL